MGGGDLNSKKSWHPNTMKNQERVWKAEQAAAEEKKRIVELQRERAQERDKAELNDLITKHKTNTADESRLSWMYDKPDKKVEQEEYLLGKSIDKSSGQDKPVQDAIPAVGRRVVGSSMLATAGDTQVDLVRKIREDPLLLIKERERAARAALLNNPLQRRRLTELLRKEQDQRKEGKIKKKSKKKDKDLDDMLAAKLNALGGKQGIDLTTLLNSDNSASDSSSEEENYVKKKKKKKEEKAKKKSKKSKKKKKLSSSDCDSDTSVKEKREKKIEDKKSKHKSAHKSDTEHSSKSKKRRSDDYTDDEIKTKSSKYDTSDRRANKEYERSSYYDRKEESKDIAYKKNYNREGDGRTKEGHRGESDVQFRRSSPRGSDRRAKDSDREDKKRRGGLSEEEKAARLAEMAAAGAEREVQRGRRVAQQRSADAAAEAATLAGRGPMKNEARSLPDSLESRLQSNRHYIQRDKRHMNEHFARRE